MSEEVPDFTVALNVQHEQEGYTLSWCSSLLGSSLLLWFFSEERIGTWGKKKYITFKKAFTLILKEYFNYYLKDTSLQNTVHMENFLIFLTQEYPVFLLLKKQKSPLKWSLTHFLP